ncbi:MAG: T9SS type A sorting domain-containing protein [Bacteroidetes bacterium]|nr:T9SS type A sorting domain-containing protein [Bacteroidota bacterium]
MTIFTHLESKLQRPATFTRSIKALILLCLWMGFSDGSILQAQSAPAITDEETPEFNFPRQIGNIWTYSNQSSLCVDESCAEMRKELIANVEIDGKSCSVFRTERVGSQHDSEEITWCFDGNKIYWLRSGVDSDGGRMDILADFGAEINQPWTLTELESHSSWAHLMDAEQLYLVRYRTDDTSNDELFNFAIHVTDDPEFIDDFILEPKFVTNEPYAITFQDGVGSLLQMYDNAYGVYLKGSYINGELAGDTTFYYITSIDFKPGLPSEFELGAYPNPFNPTTQIRFSLPMETVVELDVYTITGQHITNLVSEVRPAGTHQVTFDASDLASGVYMYRIRAGNYIETRKLTLIR